MRRMRKHIQHPGGGQVEPVLLDQHTDIPRQTSRMTLNIQHLMWPQASDDRQHLACSGARRIQEHMGIRVLEPGSVSVGMSQIGHMKFGVSHAVETRIVTSALEQRSVTLYTDDSGRPLRQGER